MDALGIVVVMVLLLGAAVVAAAVIGTVKAAKAAAVKLERHEANARRAVENVTLKAKTFTKPGPHGQLAAVRLSLRTALDSTRQVLAGGLPQDGQLGEAMQLLTRLDAHAAELDAEMRMLEREPDAARVTAKLAELRERAGRITHSAESLRWAAQDRMRRFADDELSRLTDECANEAGALRHWDTGGGAGDAGAGAGAGAGDGDARVRAGDGGGAGADGRKGLAAGRRPSAEEVLGLAEPLARLADRLRKPNAGGSSAG
ncbi:hypothetical protein [Kitasatospora sp. MBT63]|uniref:hypothetical protein n=1 Tax=Kitasatospora sp. MBT63 TaxID=1444768 RepID=UPI00053B3CF0|nr:hypothetical protein [Kitasatospora sp. MBT63]